MYGKIVITLSGITAVFKTNDYHGIYDYLTSRGFDHHTAEEVASWSPDAPYGEEYELDGAKIVITE